MKTRPYRLTVLFFFISLLLGLQQSYAGIDNTVMPPITGPFANGYSFSFQDQKFKTDGSWNNFSNLSDQETISLRVVDNIPINFNFSYQVQLKIDCYADPSHTTPDQTVNTTLTVSYNQGQATRFPAVSSYQLSHAYKMVVTVVSQGPLNGDTPPNNGMVALTGSIMVDRLYPFDQQAAVPVTMFDFDASGKQLLVNWDKQQLPGAEEYDLEWTTLDKGDDNESIITQNQTAKFAQLFKNNATRITTADHQYAISQVYNDDYLAVRIRGAQYLNGFRTTGNWTYLYNGALMYKLISSNWHEPTANWQYSAAYAEDGKRKEVVSYFDGTLRSRQTVTLDNENNVPIAQESVYDNFGRPFASILPAPVKDGGINKPYLHYFQQLNLSAQTNSPYSAADIIGNGSLSCEVSPFALSAKSGTSLYYSPQNDFLSDNTGSFDAKKGALAYLPDAGGYPLSVTQYTSDNTGRVRLQGGVGQAFQPGNGTGPSRTSKYYYAKPEQWELDQLFGNDVGFAEHYMKNMVVDPNNQVSISFINASGKTIATALTGPVPASVDALKAEPVTTTTGGPQPDVPTVTFHILKPENFVFDRSSLRLKGTTTYLASNPGTVTFDYDAQQLLYSYAQGNAQICSSCYYDLNIAVSDPCNPTVPLYSNTVAVGLQLNSANATSCQPQKDYTGTFQANFQNIGEYYVTFELVMSRSGIKNYVDNLITQGQQQQMLNTQWYFLQPYLNQIDFSGILADCKTAVQTLGSSTDFKNMVQTKLASAGIDVSTFNSSDLSAYNAWVDAKYNVLHDQCLALQAGCNYSTCNSVQDEMVRDVTPGGQYNLYDSQYQPVEKDINVVYNAFRSIFPVLPSTNATYIQNQFTREDGTVSSANDGSATYADLIKYWKGDWGPLFLSYHPEYCKLKFCNTYSIQTKDWDEKVQQTINTAADIANIQGLFAGSPAVSYSEQNGDWLLAADPFFASGNLGSNYYTAMQTDLRTYSSALTGNSGLSVKNLSQYVSYSLYCAQKCDPNDATNSCWENCTPSCNFPDRNWALYKTYYFRLKQKYIDAARLASCSTSCSIGQPYTVSNSSTCPGPFDFAISQASETDSISSHPIILDLDASPSYDESDAANHLIVTAKLSRVATADITVTVNPYYFVSGNYNYLPSVNIVIPAGTLSASVDAGVVTLPANYTGAWMAYATETSYSPSTINNNNILTWTSHSFLIPGTDAATDPLDNISFTSVYTNSGHILITAHLPTATDHDIQAIVNKVDFLSGGTSFPVVTLFAVKQGMISSDPVDIGAVATPTASYGFALQVANPVLNADGSAHQFPVFYSNVLSPLTSYAVSYLNGKVGTTTYVNLYYPPDVNTKGAPTQLVFSAGMSKQFLMLPAEIPISSVKIQGVNCTQTAPTPFTEVLPASGVPTVQYPTSSAGYVNTDANTDFYIADQQTNYTDPATGQTGLYIVVKVKPNVSICSRSGMTATVGYYSDLGQGIQPQGYTFNMSIDADTYTGAAFIPNVTISSTSLVNGNVTACSGPLAANNGCSMEYNNKQSRFDIVSQVNNFPTTLADATAQANTQLQQWAQSSCEGHAERWMKALSPGLTAALQAGKISQANIDALKAALIKFCSDNGDLQHPGGASSLNTSLYTASSNPDAPYQNFGDIIKQYGLNNLDHFTPDINPYLLEGPGPFESPQPQASATSVQQSSANLVTRLNNLNQTYLGSGSTSGSLYQYLKDTYGSAMTLSSDDLNLLWQASADCNYMLPHDIALPVFLQDGYAGCLTANQYTSDRSALLSLFGGTLTSADPNYIAILTNYFNQKYGFTLGPSDYSAYDNNPSGLLCNQPAFASVTVDRYATIENHIAIAAANTLRDYNAYIQQQRDFFTAGYISTCSAAQVSVNLAAPKQNYHYTLYYYDQADNLMQTVPPEGVQLLTDQQIQQVQQVREHPGDPAGCAVSYTGPVATDVSGASTTLSSLLSANQNGAIEFWFYNSNGGGGQFALATADGNYQLQVNISNNILSADVYSQPVSGSFTQSNHIAADFSQLPGLQNWVHVVLQSTNLLTKPIMIYLNGYRPPLVTNPAASVYAANTSTLKHLRLYSRLLSPGEIRANAASSCFIPVNNDANWFRFNIPAPGDPTAIASNSTVETSVTGIYPNHRLATSYTYNATNQVVQQHSPDGGTNNYWYDQLSRLVASQNDKQLADNNYSYTVYDALGRITEVGQKSLAGNSGLTMPPAGYLDGTTTGSFYNISANNQITQTYYDNSPVTNPSQLNLRKRVAASTYTETPAQGVQHATYYSYDIDGNVSTLWQQISGLGQKQIDYEYDLISGKVNFVRYQAGAADQFFYQYKYDAENRLTAAYSGTLGMVRPTAGSLLNTETGRRDAAYYYYLHGPLARTELGDESTLVQGLDYAYTLQGWLKGVNSQNVGAAVDVGQDGVMPSGSNVNNHQYVGRDAFGYSLGYYSGDYQPITGAASTAFGLQYSATGSDFSGQSLYNGNISSSAYSFSGWDGGAPAGYTYRYDQLNRITQFDRHSNLSAGWNGNSRIPAYQEHFSYDGNGNILAAKRWGQNSSLIDDLAYNYQRDGDGNLLNNRLSSISDNVSNSGLNGADLSDQVSNNYRYDPIGNLTGDQSASIGNIDWSVYGKIKAIYPLDSKQPAKLTYTYDPAGHRVSKATATQTTWYVRDAQGNPLALYDNAGGTINWREQQLYGSSRLGTWSRDADLAATVTDPNLSTTYWGGRQYELTNHLGNVMTTVSDRRLQQGNSNGVPNFTPDILSQTDYYAFGMIQPGRSSGNTYRYGFNGKENDNEVKGVGNQQDYGMRISDPRLGRFLSVDPLTAKYPELTPYQFASNTPIQATDQDGEEQRYYLINLHDDHPKLTLTKQEDCWKIFDRVVVKVTGLPQNKYAVYTFTPWGAGKGGGVPGSGAGNYIEDFDKDFKKDPVKAIASGEYVPNEQILKDMVKDVALTIILQKVMSSNAIKPNPNTESNIEATVGSSTTNNYRKTFFDVHPDLQGQVVVHHAVEQQMVKIYPGLFTESEINSIQNLRGIPKETNSKVHLSDIRKEWNTFYNNNPNATREDVLKQATLIDEKYGSQFKPPVKKK